MLIKVYINLMVEKYNMNKLTNILLLIAALFSLNTSASLIGDEIFLECMQSSGSPHELCEDNGAISSIVGDGVEYPDYFNFEIHSALIFQLTQYGLPLTTVHFVGGLHVMDKGSWSSGLPILTG